MILTCVVFYIPLLEGNKTKFAYFFLNILLRLFNLVSVRKNTPKKEIYYEPYIIQGICFFSRKYIFISCTLYNLLLHSDVNFLVLFFFDREKLIDA